MKTGAWVVTIPVGEIPHATFSLGVDRMAATDLDLGRYKLGWSDVEEYVFRPEKGVNEQTVRDISWWKGEPDWMTKFRLKSLKHFERKPMAPWFAASMPDIDFNDIYYYIKPRTSRSTSGTSCPRP